jgi:hypothetical protein
VRAPRDPERWKMTVALKDWLGAEVYSQELEPDVIW